MDWGHAAEVAVGSAPGIILVLSYFFRLDRRLQRWMVEHEVLMDWFCKEHGVEKRNLPTRSKGIA